MTSPSTLLHRDDTLTIPLLGGLPTQPTSAWALSAAPAVRISGEKLKLTKRVEAGGIEPPSETEEAETLSDLESPGVRISSVDAPGLYP